MSLVPILIKNEEQKGIEQTGTSCNDSFRIYNRRRKLLSEVVFEVERNVLLAYEYQSG